MIGNAGARTEKVVKKTPLVSHFHCVEKETVTVTRVLGFCFVQCNLGDDVTRVLGDVK